MKKRNNPHIGGKFEDWLKDEGIYETTTRAATKTVRSAQNRNKAALGHTIKEITQAHVQRDPKFLRALLREAQQALLAQDISGAHLLIRDAIHGLDHAGWQPLRTAPKDGTELIFWVSSQKGFADMTANFYFHNRAWRWADTDERLKRPDLVHGWMPYPQPPQMSPKHRQRTQKRNQP